MEQVGPTCREEPTNDICALRYDRHCDNLWLNVSIGQFVGSVVSFPLTALLCKYGFNGGWPSVFYIFGKQDIIFNIIKGNSQSYI